MANTCSNMLFLSTDNQTNYKILTESIQKHLHCYNFSEQKNGKSCDIDFESKWTFPEEFFQELTATLEADDTLYIRVLSYEFGCDYVGYNIFQNNEWHNKIRD